MRSSYVTIASLVSIVAGSLVGCNGSSSENERINERPLMPAQSSDASHPASANPSLWSGPTGDDSSDPNNVIVHHLYDNHEDGDLGVTAADGEKLILLDLEFTDESNLENLYEIMEHWALLLVSDQSAPSETQRVEFDILSSDVAYVPLSARGLKTGNLNTNRMGLALAVPADTQAIQIANGDTVVTPSPLPLGTGPLTKPW